MSNSHGFEVSRCQIRLVRRDDPVRKEVGQAALIEAEGDTGLCETSAEGGKGRPSIGCGAGVDREHSNCRISRVLALLRLGNQAEKKSCGTDG
jgi:hypothetical protein